jgi:hypothetical protein
MFKGTRLSKFFVIPAMLALFGVTTALADPIALKIQSGATTIIVSDENVVITPGATNSDQSLGVPGEISWSGKVGSWTVLVDLGLGSLILGVDSMDLSYNVISTAALPSAPLIISFTEVNVHSPVPGGFVAGIGGTNTASTTQYSASYDTTNGYFQPGTLITSSPTFLPPSFHFDGTGAGSATTPFSVTEKITINATGGAGKPLASGDANLRSVQEPSALLLMSSGLIAFALVLRRRAQFAKA